MFNKRGIALVLCPPGQGFWRWIRRRTNAPPTPITVATAAAVPRTTGGGGRSMINTKRVQRDAKSR